jgi:hypothetical protein
MVKRFWLSLAGVVGLASLVLSAGEFAQEPTSLQCLISKLPSLADLFDDPLQSILIRSLP